MATAQSTAKTPTIDAAIASDHSSLTLRFSHGETLTIRVGDLTPTILAQATIHGLKQKLVDAAAISRNPETGRSASVVDKYEAVREVYDRLLSGEWNKRREGSGGSGNGLLFRALCRMYEGKKSPEAVKAFLDAKTDAEKAAMRKDIRIAQVIEEIRAESVDTNGVCVDDLLADLED